MIRFLLKSAFWLTLVLLLLPEFGARPPARDADAAVPAAGASGEASAEGASSLLWAALDDASSFCERQASACEIGGSLLAAMGERLRSGALILADMLGGEDPAPHDPAGADNAARPPQRGTLKAADLTPRWETGADGARAIEPPAN